MKARVVGSLFMLTVIVIGSASAQVEGFPKGTYTATIRGDKWTINLEEKGTFTFMRKGELVVKGTYKGIKNQIEFDDAPDLKGARTALQAKPGTYSWKLEGDKLSFIKIADESKSRVKALTGQAWTREK